MRHVIVEDDAAGAWTAGVWLVESAIVSYDGRQQPCRFRNPQAKGYNKNNNNNKYKRPADRTVGRRGESPPGQHRVVYRTPNLESATNGEFLSTFPLWLITRVERPVFFFLFLVARSKSLSSARGKRDEVRIRKNLEKASRWCPPGPLRLRPPFSPSLFPHSSFRYVFDSSSSFSQFFIGFVRLCKRLDPAVYVFVAELHLRSSFFSLKFWQPKNSGPRPTNRRLHTRTLNADDSWKRIKIAKQTLEKKVSGRSFKR